jgi:hypothetical protein
MSIRAKSSPSPVDLLDSYRRSLNDLNGPIGDQVSVQIEVNPGDEIAKFTIRVPSSFLHRETRFPLLTISTRSEADLDLSPMITELMSMAVGSSVSISRVPSGEGGYKISLEYSGTETATDQDIVVQFLAWDTVSALAGDAPYVLSTLRFVLDFPALEEIPVLVTLILPEDSSPRSIQGSYVLAYPSRTYAGRRYLNLYFRKDRPIRLTTTFGPTNDITDVWFSFGKLAGALALVAFITSLHSSADSAVSVLAVLTSIATLAGIAGQIFRQVTEISLYRKVGRLLQDTLLVAESIGASAIIISLFVLRDSVGKTPAHWTTIMLAALSAISIGVAACGLALHRVGYWHRFVCDYEGCEVILRNRSSRPECRYTGRVFCDIHIKRVCETCVHGVELRNRSLLPGKLFDFRSIPCRDGN